MKYYIIAGEASGDLHASNLMKAILRQDKDASFRFFGGDLMQAVGGTLVKHYKHLAFMGFWEVLKNIRVILKNIRFCKEDIANYRPDTIVFVDYPGFNLRICQWAKQQGFSTHYYISPQIWAWKESRIKSIKRNVDQMYVILPFEKEFYEKKHHYPVHFVGHPLLDPICNRKPTNSKDFKEKYKLDEKPIIALLPGSRKQEIRKILPVMLSLAKHLEDYQFVVAVASSQCTDFFRKFIKDNNISLIKNDTYSLLEVSNLAVVTSGTATLETALMNVPEVVCYKSSFLSYQIAKRLVKLSYISLVNLIMEKTVVCELIQGQCNEKRLLSEVYKLTDGSFRRKMKNNFVQLKQKLGGRGASYKTAKLITQYCYNAKKL